MSPFWLGLLESLSIYYNCLTSRIKIWSHILSTCHVIRSILCHLVSSEYLYWSCIYDTTDHVMILVLQHNKSFVHYQIKVHITSSHLRSWWLILPGQSRLLFWPDLCQYNFIHFLFQSWVHVTKTIIFAISSTKEWVARCLLLLNFIDSSLHSFIPGSVLIILENSFLYRAIKNGKQVLREIGLHLHYYFFQIITTYAINLHVRIWSFFIPSFSLWDIGCVRSNTIKMNGSTTIYQNFWWPK